MSKAKIKAALEFAERHGGTDGAHHKQWVIDQMVRALTGKDYTAWVEQYELCERCGGEREIDIAHGLASEYVECSDCEGTGYAREWDEGIPP